MSSNEFNTNKVEYDSQESYTSFPNEFTYYSQEMPSMNNDYMNYGLSEDKSMIQYQVSLSSPMDACFMDNKNMAPISTVMETVDSGSHLIDGTSYGHQFYDNTSFQGNFYEAENNTSSSFTSLLTANNSQHNDAMQVQYEYNLSNVSSKTVTETVDNSSQKSPTGMTPSELDQKLMQKRERNRIAARKCRDRKLSKIKEYEDKIQKLQGEIRSFEEEIADLNTRKHHLRLMLLKFYSSCCFQPHITSNMPTAQY